MSLNCGRSFFIRPYCFYSHGLFRIPLSHFQLPFPRSVMIGGKERNRDASILSVFLYCVGVGLLIWLFYQLKCRIMAAFVFDFKAEWRRRIFSRLRYSYWRCVFLERSHRRGPGLPIQSAVARLRRSQNDPVVTAAKSCRGSKSKDKIALFSCFRNHFIFCNISWFSGHIQWLNAYSSLSVDLTQCYCQSCMNG